MLVFSQVLQIAQVFPKIFFLGISWDLFQSPAGCAQYADFFLFLV